MLRDDFTPIVDANSILSSVAMRFQPEINQLYVNGTAKTIDVPATIINDRTMVPVRAISEALSCNVEWKADTRTVDITR